MERFAQAMLVVLGCGVAAGCGREEPPLPQAKPRAQAPIGYSVASPTIPEETLTPASNAISAPPMPPYPVVDLSAPAEIPKEVPTYAGAEIVQIVSVPMGIYTMLRTPDAPSQVMLFYRERLASDGWTANLTTAAVGTEMTSFVRGTNRLSVIVSRPQNETLISLTFSSP